MRRLIFLIALAIALPATAQSEKLPQLEPIPEPPPPPPGYEPEPALEPQVTIVRRGEDIVEEYRIRGRLYMVKVTPPHGRPYFMVDYRGDGVFTAVNSPTPILSVPQWVIMEW
jgi:hypothetical protein